MIKCWGGGIMIKWWVGNNDKVLGWGIMIKWSVGNNDKVWWI